MYQKKFILFGSCATGEDTNESDIDLFILTNEKDIVIKYTNNRNFEREIQAVIVSAVEFMKLKEQDKAFYQEIKKGIILWNSKNE
ncbi:nucleotidyltransferase family protein [Thermoplasmatales archaeon SCGC AB-540-F20]|nr:nucleotidyltransferase family protein [Thermoplasmatales archaeon SCGC AB-540-F20]